MKVKNPSIDQTPLFSTSLSPAAILIGSETSRRMLMGHDARSLAPHGHARSCMHATGKGNRDSLLAGPRNANRNVNP